MDSSMSFFLFYGPSAPAFCQRADRKTGIEDQIDYRIIK